MLSLYIEKLARLGASRVGRRHTRNADNEGQTASRKDETRHMAAHIKELCAGGLLTERRKSVAAGRHVADLLSQAKGHCWKMRRFRRTAQLGIHRS